ncbi:T9SS type A sorting domain-containing protein [Saccharicrinis sp. FJH54]|uniref:T9SS type A sorting domain-containing protein n=1 Tax=Saccharicrinis sp. FJH54 TaxID=3344665 RepID=UPI0035D3FF1B
MKKFFTLIVFFIVAYATINAQKNVVYICVTDLASGDAIESEQPVIDAIKAGKGGDYFTVTPFDASSITSEDVLTTLNAADVVIVGRSVNSGDVINDPQSEIYRKITAPVIHTSPWVIRGDRLGYVTGGTEHQNTDDAKVVQAQIQDLSSPVFDGITNSTIDWTIGYTSNLTPETGDAGGTTLAKTDDDRILLILHDANVTLPASGRTPLGPRAYMGNGQDNVEPATYWNYAEDGAKVFINLVAYMADQATSIAGTKTEAAQLLIVNYNGTVRISNNKLSDVNVYTLSGQLVNKPVVSNHTAEVSNLNKGVYLVKATVDNQTVTGKFIVQ